MTFPTNAYLATGVAALLGTLLSMPLWRWWCIRTGHVDDPGHRKIHDKPISLAGGLGVLTGLSHSNHRWRARPVHELAAT